MDNAGNPAAGEPPAEAEASPTAPQPPPFGGPWHSRPKLTGDWCGLREQLRDNGFTFDISATTYYQGIASGGLQETFRFGGRNDYLLNVDGQKAGLWQGLSINLHGETVYGDSVNLATGAVVPVNIGRAHPVFFGTETALTAVKFTQALSENFVLFAGKINTIDNVQQPFMPGRGLDAGFMNAAFVWNPILGRTMNYSTFGAGAAILAGGYPVLTLTVYDTNDASTTSGFDELFDNGAVIYPTVSLPTKFFGMPGHQSVWGAYSSGTLCHRDPAIVDISSPSRCKDFPRLTTLVRGSWWITYLFDQALWVDPTDQTRSWGVFGNAGISDGKPNPIRLVRHRWHRREQPDPQPQTGYLRHRLLLPGVQRRLQERCPADRARCATSAAWNSSTTSAVTPWCHVTADLQVITPILERAETSLVLGLRAKIDF